MFEKLMSMFTVGGEGTGLYRRDSIGITSSLSSSRIRIVLAPRDRVVLNILSFEGLGRGT